MGVNNSFFILYFFIFFNLFSISVCLLNSPIHSLQLRARSQILLASHSPWEIWVRNQLPHSFRFYLLVHNDVGQIKTITRNKWYLAEIPYLRIIPAYVSIRVRRYRACKDCKFFFSITCLSTFACAHGQKSAGIFGPTSSEIIVFDCQLVITSSNSFCFLF